MGYDRDDYRGARPGPQSNPRPYGNDDYQRDGRGYDRSYIPGGQRGEDRGFLDRAGDEVRSWFGDDDHDHLRNGGHSRSHYGSRSREDHARDYQRDGERSRGDHNDGIFDRLGRWFEGGQARETQSHRTRHDSHEDHNDYKGWRTRQMEELDRDYHEYRQENRSRFETEFGEFRARRQAQRASLGQVREHFEVLGSDGEHLGKVDKVRGDRIILAKNDMSTGGHHHSIPSSWLQSVDGERVTITKTAGEAKRAWTDLDKDGAMFNDSPGADQGDGAHILNRSFSGTY